MNFGVLMWFGSGQQLFSRQYLFMPMYGPSGKTMTRADHEWVPKLYTVPQPDSGTNAFKIGMSVA